MPPERPFTLGEPASEPVSEPAETPLTALTAARRIDQAHTAMRDVTGTVPTAASAPAQSPAAFSAFAPAWQAGPANTAIGRGLY
jgi:hypothetical protein